MFGTKDSTFSGFDINCLVLDHLFVSSWLGMRKVSSVDSSLSQVKSDSSGTCFFDNGCPTGEAVSSLLVPDAQIKSSLSF